MLFIAEFCYHVQQIFQIYAINNQMLLQACTLIVIGIVVGISQAAGIGGGVIINVLLISGLNYNAKSSVFITYIFLMGGGLASTIKSIRKSSKTGKHVMDYNLIMITLPMMISGAIIGTIINHFISELVITFLFIALILYLIYTTYNKLNQNKNKESPTTSIASTVDKNDNVQEMKPIDSPQQISRLEQIIKIQMRLFPTDKIKIIIQIYIYTIVLILCRGGKNFDSFIGLDSCSYGSWFCAILHLILSYLYSKSIAIKKFHLDQEKQSLGFVFDDNNDKMSDEKMRQGMFNGFVAGLLGGCVSIGGGMILVPLWIKSGMNHNTAANSTGPLIFFSASISFFISCLLESYNSILQVMLYFALSFTGSYVIKKYISHLAIKYNFKQMIFVLLLFLMVVSLLILLPFQYIKYTKEPQRFMQFDILC